VSHHWWRQQQCERGPARWLPLTRMKRVNSGVVCLESVAEVSHVGRWFFGVARWSRLVGLYRSGRRRALFSDAGRAWRWYDFRSVRCLVAARRGHTQTPTVHIFLRSATLPKSSLRISPRQITLVDAAVFAVFRPLHTSSCSAITTAATGSAATHRPNARSHTLLPAQCAARPLRRCDHLPLLARVFMQSS